MQYQNLNQQFQNYLVRKTKHAVILTGGWGIGKTHYMQTAFQELATENKFTRIHISLFGVSSIDQIKDQIFLQLYPIFNNKYVKGAGVVLKAAFKVVDLSKIVTAMAADNSSDAANDVTKSLGKMKLDLSNTKNMVICFDDLERAHPDKLTANEILGFINLLIEDNVKVIIIANEGELFDKEKYAEIKEKTIHQTIHFKQDFNESFAAILANEPHLPGYISFLNENKETIKDALIENDQVNLRTLSYFISFFGDIHSFVDQQLQVPELTSYKAELLDMLINFSLMIVAEFKRGELTYDNQRDLKDGLDVSMIDYLLSKKEREATYAEKTIRKYYKENNYHFYLSVFDYLTGGDPFMGENLRKEIYDQYHVVSETISPAYQVFNKLASRDSVVLSDAEFRELTRQMKDFALAGEYAIEQYTSIYYYIVRYGNILGLNLDKLSRQFVSVLKSKKHLQQYNPVIDRYLSSAKDSEFRVQLEPIAAVIIKGNNDAFTRDKSAYANRIEEELAKNVKGLLSRLTKEIAEPYHQVSLGMVNPRKFMAAFSKGSNENKQALLHILFVVFDRSYFLNRSPEHLFLIELDKLMDNYLAKPKNKRSNSGQIAIGVSKFIKEKVII